jgi:hypothetical protein
MDVRSEIIPGVKMYNWFEGHPYPPPLHGPAITWCIEAIYNAIDLLGKHEPEHGDAARPNAPDPWNAGYFRRLQILRKLSTGPVPKDRNRITASLPGPKSGSFHQIALNLRQILTDEHPRHLLNPKDPELNYLTLTYLIESAMEIHGDITRTYKAMRAPAVAIEFNYEGRPTKK